MFLETSQITLSAGAQVPRQHEIFMGPIHVSAMTVTSRSLTEPLRVSSRTKGGECSGARWWSLAASLVRNRENEWQDVEGRDKEEGGNWDDFFLVNVCLCIKIVWQLGRGRSERTNSYHTAFVSQECRPLALPFSGHELISLIGNSKTHLIKLWWDTNELLSLVIKAVPGPETALRKSGYHISSVWGREWQMQLAASRCFQKYLCLNVWIQHKNDLYSFSANVAVPKHTS